MPGICILRLRQRGLETESKDTRIVPHPTGGTTSRPLLLRSTLIHEARIASVCSPSLMLTRPLHGPTPARRSDPQKASGNESWPGASPRSRLVPAFGEARFRGLYDNCRSPADGPPKHLPPAVQSQLPDSRGSTSHRAEVGRLPLPHPRDCQRTAPGRCATTLQTAPGRLGRAGGGGEPRHGHCALRARLLHAAGSRLSPRRGHTQRHQTECATFLSGASGEQATRRCLQPQAPRRAMIKANFCCTQCWYVHDLPPVFCVTSRSISRNRRGPIGRGLVFALVAHVSSAL